MKTQFSFITFVILSIVLFFPCSNTYAQRPFVTTWSADSDSLRLAIEGSYSYTWEDVTDLQSKRTGMGRDSLYLAFPKGGQYRLSLVPIGDNPMHKFKASSNLMRIEQWGDVRWSTMKEAFSGTPNMVMVAKDIPDLSAVTDMSYMFYNGGRRNYSHTSKDETFDPSISRWDVSTVTTMKGLFKESKGFNQSLNHWDVRQVTDFSNLFQDAELFNKPLNRWDVSRATDMSGMFQGTQAFNQPLNRWDVSRVTDMSSMFRGTHAFNQSLSRWNVKQVMDMSDMFRYANRFNKRLKAWNVSQVTNMSGMFFRSRYNQSLKNWEVSKVQDMSEMFKENWSFNASVANWNLVNTVSLERMFEENQVFNHPSINTWDVSAVVSMKGMFSKAQVFNQSLDHWNTQNVLYMDDMFRDTPLFNGKIGTWDVRNVISMVSMFQNAKAFNQPIGDWNTESLTDIHSLFLVAPSFNQPLNRWNVSKVSNMSNLFDQAASFDQPLNTWKVGKVTSMYNMFSSTSFNQPLDMWDVSEVVHMGGMFRDTENFNQPLDTWKVSKVKNMSALFSGAKAFNQPLDAWDVSQVHDMSFMFSNSSAFNQPLDSWNVSNVTNMMYMFSGARAFNQSLKDWNVSQVTQMPRMFESSRLFNQPLDSWDLHTEAKTTAMFENSGMSRYNYEKTIDRWAFKSSKGQEAVRTNAKPFITVWNIDEKDLYGETYSFSKSLGGMYSYSWEHMEKPAIKGEGWGEGRLSISFPEAGIYKLSLYPEGQNPLHSFHFKSSDLYHTYDPEKDISKLIDVLQWGDIRWSTMKYAFQGAVNMTLSAIDIPDLSLVNDMSYMFQNRRTTSQIENPKPFNTSIRDWDVSEVVSMKNMFEGAKAFDMSLDTWDIKKAAKSTYKMFNESGITYENYKKTMHSWARQVNGSTAQVEDVRPFITVWEVKDRRVERLLEGAYTYTWEDVNDKSQKGRGWGSGYWRVVFPKEGTYRVAFTPIGLFPLHAFSSFREGTMEDYVDLRYAANLPRKNPFNYAQGDIRNLIAIEQWGAITWSSMENAFNGADKLTISASDTPDLSAVRTMFRMFYGTAVNQSIEHWDVSQVIDMSEMFGYTTKFNQPLEKWNVSQVKDMSYMFVGSVFNQPLESWDTSQVTDMRGMFQKAENFNQPLEKWNVGKVLNMASMFEKASRFNQPLENWEVSQVSSMRNMFADAMTFNQPLNNWDVSNLEDGISFSGATSFNQPLGKWWFRSIGRNRINFDDSGMDPLNYGHTLKAWALNSKMTKRLSLEARGVLYYADFEFYRDLLIQEKGWQISGDAKKGDE